MQTTEGRSAVAPGRGCAAHATEALRAGFVSCGRPPAAGSPRRPRVLASAATVSALPHGGRTRMARAYPEELRLLALFRRASAALL
jgi:hypothetical protein